MVCLSGKGQKTEVKRGKVEEGETELGILTQLGKGHVSGDVKFHGPDRHESGGGPQE